MSSFDDSVSVPANAELASAELAALKMEEDSDLALKRRRIYLAFAYVFCCLVWGTTWYGVRVSVDPALGLPPNFAGAFRFLIAVLLYLPLCLIFARKIKFPNLKETLWVCLAGLFNGLFQCFIYTAECSISGGLASVIMSTSPLMMAFMVAGLGMEKVSRQTVIGFVICSIGIAFVCQDSMQASSAQMLGLIYAFIAVVFSSMSNVALKGKSSHLHPLASAVVFLASTDIPIWIASFMLAEKASFTPFPTAAVIAIIYMAVASSIMAFLLYLYLLRHMKLTTLSTMQFIIPVVALLVDMLLEKKMLLSPETWCGIVVVLLGVLLAMLRR